MGDIEGTSTGHPARFWVTPIADLATAAAYFFLLPVLTGLFHSKSGLNGLLVIAGYFVLCIATWQLMRLQPFKGTVEGQGKRLETSSGCLGFLSLCFGIVIVVMVLELSGVLDSGGLLEDSSTDSFIGPMFGLFMFVVSLTYLFVVLLRPKPTIKPGTVGHTMRHVLGVAGVNSMFIITLAFWDSYLAEAESTGGSTGQHILMFLLFYVVMVMFLAPPRIILNIIEGSKWGLISFSFWLAIYCWDLTK